MAWVGDVRSTAVTIGEMASYVASMNGLYYGLCYTTTVCNCSMKI